MDDHISFREVSKIYPYVFVLSDMVGAENGNRGSEGSLFVTRLLTAILAVALFSALDLPRTKQEIDITWHVDCSYVCDVIVGDGIYIFFNSLVVVCLVIGSFVLVSIGEMVTRSVLSGEC